MNEIRKYCIKQATIEALKRTIVKMIQTQGILQVDARDHYGFLHLILSRSIAEDYLSKELHLSQRSMYLLQRQYRS